jgi:hypothetical protein
MVRKPWRSRVRAFVYGAVAGINAAACMSGLRLAARRAGLIEAMPPQVLREAASRRTKTPAAYVSPQLADHALHLTVGLVGGGIYGALFGHRAVPRTGSGLLWGVGLWAASLAVLMPALRTRRFRAQVDMPQNAVNFAAHLVYGGVLSLMMRDMVEQDRRRQWRGDRETRRVG